MLVLERKRFGKIHIGNDITLTVVEIRGGKVRLSVNAPREVSIRRAEHIDEAEEQRLKRLALLRRKP